MPAVTPRPGRRSAACIARDGEVVGTGATGPFPGRPHAEVAALAPPETGPGGHRRTARSSRATTTGNTPPCTDALIEAGVARVVVAVGDPDERVAGRGYRPAARRRTSRYDGVGAAEAERDLAPYLHHRRTGQAFVVAKAALEPRRTRGRGRRLVAVDHRARPAPTRTSCAPTPRRSWSGRAPRSPTGPRSPCAAVDVRRRAHRCACCSTRAAGWRPTGPLFDPALGPTLVVTTESARAGAVDAWRAARRQGRGGRAGRRRPGRRPRRRVRAPRPRRRAPGPRRGRR